MRSLLAVTEAACPATVASCGPFWSEGTTLWPDCSARKVKLIDEMAPERGLHFFSCVDLLISSIHVFDYSFSAADYFNWRFFVWYFILNSRELP